MNEQLINITTPITRTESFKILWKMLVSSRDSYNLSMLTPLLESLEENIYDEIDYKSCYDDVSKVESFIPIKFNPYKSKSAKGRPGMPYPERVLYRLVAKKVPKHQGITFDNNQIRWIAYWKNDMGKQTQRHFPVYKFGFLGGLKMAINFRESQNKLFNETKQIKSQICKDTFSTMPTIPDLQNTCYKLPRQQIINTLNENELKCKKQKIPLQNHMYIKHNYNKPTHFQMNPPETKTFNMYNTIAQRAKNISNENLQPPNSQYSVNNKQTHLFELTKEDTEYAKQHCQESTKIHDCELSKFTRTRLDNLEYCFCNCITNGTLTTANLLNFIRNYLFNL